MNELLTIDDGRDFYGMNLIRKYVVTMYLNDWR